MKCGVVSLGVGIGAALLLAPNQAQACSPAECEGQSGFREFSVAQTAVARDGVLVFRQRRQGGTGLSDADTLPFITIAVGDSAGEAVEGALEMSGDVFFWRPDAELPVGETLSVAVSIDNLGLGAYEGCEFSGELGMVSVVDAAVPTFALPEISFSTAYAFSPSRDLDAYVCCDGGYPEEDYGGCGGEDPPFISGPGGHCVASRGTGYAEALFELEGLDEIASASMRVELLADGEVLSSNLGINVGAAGIRSRLDRAFDAELRFVSLIDGTEVISEVFVADGEQPDALGETTPAISDELEEVCENPAYRCDAYPGDLTDPGEWDPEACEPFEGDAEGSDEDADAAGCGCTSVGGSRGGGAFFLILAVGLLRRRRIA